MHSDLQGGAETLLTSSEIVGKDPGSEARALFCIGKISNNLEAKEQLTLKTKAQNTFQAPRGTQTGGRVKKAHDSETFIPQVGNA